MEKSENIIKEDPEEIIIEEVYKEDNEVMDKKVEAEQNIKEEIKIEKGSPKKEQKET